MNRTLGIILVVLGLVGIVVPFVVPSLGGVGVPPGHLKADGLLVLGIVLLVVGVFGMMRKSS